MSKNSIAHQYILDCMNDMNRLISVRIEHAATLLSRGMSVKEATAFLESVVSDKKRTPPEREMAANTLLNYEWLNRPPMLTWGGSPQVISYGETDA